MLLLRTVQLPVTIGRGLSRASNQLCERFVQLLTGPGPLKGLGPSEGPEIVKGAF